MSDRNKVDDEDGTPPPSAKKRGASGGDSGWGGKSGVKGGGKVRNSNWGRVFRTAYDDTLREPIPNELRDLLGKLD